MPSHSRQHSDAIVEKILQAAALPRQAASVKEAFEKKNPDSDASKTPGGNKAGKPEPLKPEFQSKEKATGRRVA